MLGLEGSRLNVCVAPNRQGRQDRNRHHTCNRKACMRLPLAKARSTWHDEMQRCRSCMNQQANGGGAPRPENVHFLSYVITLKFALQIHGMNLLQRARHTYPLASAS